MCIKTIAKAAAVANCHVMDNRHRRPPRCKPLFVDMVETFSAARLPREAMRALTYLAEVQRLEKDTVAYVLDFVQRLQTFPDVFFVPPDGVEPS